MEARIFTQVRYVKRTIQKIYLFYERLKAPDFYEDGEKTQSKEWLVYQEYWRGKDWLGKRMFTSNIEGVFTEQTKEIDTQFDSKTGEINARYIQGKPRSRYYIPFSKNAVDNALKKLKTDSNQIMWIGEIGNSSQGPGLICADYNDKQFTESSWKELEDLARQPGGPNNRVYQANAPQLKPFAGVPVQ